MRIQTACAMLGDDLIGQSQPVCASDSVDARIPEEQVHVVRVEHVHVRASARPLADGTERQLAQSADLLKDAGYLVRLRVIHTEPAALDQSLAQGQRVDLRAQCCPGKLVDERCGWPSLHRSPVTPECV